MQEILRLIESLRSGLAKNAMLALTEICQELKKAVDPEVDQIILKLLKKGMDANAFISKEVRECLQQVCLNCSDCKILPVLLQQAQNRAVQTKINIALSLETIVEKNGQKTMQMKDLDKFLFVLCSYTQESALEIRNISKRAFVNLHKYIVNKIEFDKILQRVLPEQVLSKIVLMQEKEKLGQTNFMITNNQLKKEKPNQFLQKDKPQVLHQTSKDESGLAPELAAEKQNQTSYNTSKAAGFRGKEPPEFEAFPTLFTNCEN